MKIIDLLNKIANGEEINKFKYYGGTYIYDKETQKYWYEDMWFDLDFCNLNDEVEILEEEKKIPEKLKLSSHWNGTFEQEQKYRNKRDVEIAFKINSIIEYLKSKGE